MIITILDKPRSGRFDRICLKCGESYFGYNMYVCRECENRGGYTIEEEWCK